MLLILGAFICAW